MGRLYVEGRAVKKQPEVAMQWFLQAAALGYRLAQYNLGVCYDEGLGVRKDPEENAGEAVRWYRESAKKGYVEAQFNLGVCLEAGVGTRKDAAEAARWYTRAAKQGHSQACVNLSTLYYYGRGVDKDVVKACLWMMIAVRMDHAKAADGVKALKEELTPDQWTEVRRFAAEFTAVEEPDPSLTSALETLPVFDPTVGTDDAASDPVANRQRVLLYVVEKVARAILPAANEDDSWAMARRLVVKRDPSERDAEAAVAYSTGMLFVDASNPKAEAAAGRHFLRAARAGHAEAQLMLAALDAKNTPYPPGVLAQSYQWALLAAAGGSPRAPTLVRVLEKALTKEQKAEGKRLAEAFTPEQLVSSRDILLSAAKAPLPPKVLADAIELTKRIAQDPDRPLSQDELQTLMSAAGHGDAGAMFCLAQLYERGHGVTKNMSLAALWFHAAADKGHAAAQYAIGMLLDLGRDIEKDEEDAAHWLQRAAAQGLAKAQVRLASMTGLGRGVSRDTVSAYKWLLLAAAAGEESAIQHVRGVEALLSPEEKAEGRRQADAFVPMPE